MLTSVKPVRNASAAAKYVASTLGLDDQKRVATALAIAAAEEVDYNRIFRERIRATYDRLPASTTHATSTKTSKALTLNLVPVKHVEGFELNPSAPLNPYLVYEAFGAHQFRDALDIFSQAKLQNAARMIMERHPKTKPQNMRSKAAIIDYIEQYVQRR